MVSQVRAAERLSPTRPESPLRRLVHLRESEIAGPDALAERAHQWVATCGLLYRVVATPIPLIGFVAEVGLSHAAKLIGAVMLGALIVNSVLVVTALRQGSLDFMHRPLIMVVDGCVALGLNLWASAVLVPGTLNQSYRDVFWFYLMATVAMWFGLAGGPATLVLIGASVPAQLGMVQFNEPGQAIDWPHVVTRECWLVLAVVIQIVLANLLRRSAIAALSTGHRAGAQAEQMKMLREMHDTVLQTLEAIVLITQGGHRSEMQVADIRTMARKQAADLRAMLTVVPSVEGRSDGRGPDRAQMRQFRFIAELRALTSQAVGHGLPVELVTAEVDDGPDVTQLAALCAAAGEALTNVSKHAGATRAVLRAVTRPDRIEISVRDHGVGFDPDAIGSDGFGIRQSIVARMREAGGDASIWSQPGQGTRVTIWMDR